MRSALHRSPTGCFLCDYFCESAHIEKGEPVHLVVCPLHCHVWFSREKTSALFTNDPAAFSADIPATAAQTKCGTAKDKGLFHGSQHLTSGVEEENSVAGGSHSHTGQRPAQGGPLAGSGQHTAKFCFPEVHPPCPEQGPVWI